MRAVARGVIKRAVSDMERSAAAKIVLIGMDFVEVGVLLTQDELEKVCAALREDGPVGPCRGCTELTAAVRTAERAMHASARLAEEARTALGGALVQAAMTAAEGRGAR